MTIGQINEEIKIYNLPYTPWYYGKEVRFLGWRHKKDDSSDYLNKQEMMEIISASKSQLIHSEK